MLRPVTTRPDFWTVFGSGVNIGAVTAGPVSNQFHLPITGTDSVTGYATTALGTIYGGSPTYEIQGISNASPATTDYPTYFTSSIDTVSDPIVKGARQLNHGCLFQDISASNPQSQLYVGISSTNALATPITSQYWEIDTILPADLDLQGGYPGLGKFWIIAEFKTGAWFDPGSSTYKQAVGDYRFKVGLTGISGVNQWNVICDDDANGRNNSTIPELMVPPYNTPAYKYFDWADPDQAVYLGVRTKVKIYYKRPVGGTADLNTGRLRVDIKQYGYDGFTLCNIAGNQQLCGQINLPLTRLFFGSNYHSATKPNNTIIESLQIYNNPSTDLLNRLFCS